MIFLAITEKGLKEAIEMKKITSLHIWCGLDAMSEFNEMEKGISKFDYHLKGEKKEIIEDALNTIKEHHPGEVIWIESDF